MEKYVKKSIIPETEMDKHVLENYPDVLFFINSIQKGNVVEYNCMTENRQKYPISPEQFVKYYAKAIY